MDFYVTYFNNPKNTSAEYQKRGNVWYKRKKDSKEPWIKIESKYNQYLNETFKVKMLSNIRPIFRFGIPIILIAGSVLIYKRFAK